MDHDRDEHRLLGRLRRKPGWVLLVLGVMIMGGLLFTQQVLFTSKDDPIYVGKHLSRHLMSFQHCSFVFNGLENLTEPSFTFEVADRRAGNLAFEAIDRAGTNALPLLLNMLQAKDKPTRPWIEKLTRKYRWVRKLVPAPPYNAGFFQLQSLIGFQRLGPKAAPAIPQLIPLIQAPTCAVFAAYALWLIRPEHETDILSLTNVLRIGPSADNPATMVSLIHSTVITLLGSFGPKASGAIPILKDCLRSQDEETCSAAAVALVRIGAPATEMVPWLIKRIPPAHEPDLKPMLKYLWAFGAYGRDAQVALPVLTNLESYNISNVKVAARDTAEKIRTDNQVITQ